MKKCIALILSLIYLTTSSGMVMNVQYCFEKIASVKIEGFGKDKCCCTKSPKKAGCCSNELKVVKVDVSNAASSVDYKFEAPVLFLNTTFLYNPSQVIYSDVEPLHFSDSSPPLAAATPI